MADILSDLTFTLAQLNPVVGDLSGNSAKILKVWQETDSDLVIFPEMIVCGYPPEDLVLKPFFLNQIENTVENICKASKSFSAAALISCPWRVNGSVYNAALLIRGGRIVAVRLKHHLPNYGVFDEIRVFASGPLPDPVEFKGHKLGIMICEDMWYPDVSAHLKKLDAEILIVPNGSPFDSDKGDIRQHHAHARVQETELPLIYVNQIGGQDELVFDGGSFLLGADGTYKTLLKQFEEDLASTSQNVIHNPYSGPEALYKALTLGLKDYIHKNAFPGVVIGLSGGVDSALSAVIAAEALGSEAVHAVMMPSRYTSPESLEDAAKLADNLGIQYDVIDIEPMMTAFYNALDPFATQAESPVTYENIQSRIRGTILMALSNASGHMVLSTGNKSEMAVGYATLYGDMNGGFNALKDLYKTQVYQMCAWRNEQSPVIPENILTKAPTAELKADQTDQDTLPEYAELDDILMCLIERDMGVDSIVERGHEPATVAKVWRMLDRAEYKRRQAPPGVKLTTRAFGRDRRYPITNHFVNIVEKP